MFFPILIYNFVMFGLDLIALIAVYSKQRSWLVSSCVALSILTAACGVAVLLCGVSFTGLHLITYGVMFHVPLVLLCMGIICWRHARALSATAFLLGTLNLAVAMDSLLIEPYWLEVTYHEIPTAKVDRPIRIGIIADLQTDQLSDYERRVFQRLSAESPDVVLFAGDYLQAGQEDWFELARRYRKFFRELDLGSSLGAYAVGGNTDHSQWSAIFEDSTIRAIAQTEISANDQFQVTGLSVDDSFDTRLTVPGTDRYHIVLGHAPDFALGKIEADLLVAGHTHGGQVQLPFFGPIITLSAVPRSWASGITQLPGGQTLVVSRGIGMERGDAPRIRFLCRPQLLILDLVPIDAPAAVADARRRVTDSAPH